MLVSIESCPQSPGGCHHAGVFRHALTKVRIAQHFEQGRGQRRRVMRWHRSANGWTDEFGNTPHRSGNNRATELRGGRFSEQPASSVNYAARR